MCKPVPGRRRSFCQWSASDPGHGIGLSLFGPYSSLPVLSAVSLTCAVGSVSQPSLGSLTGSVTVSSQLHNSHTFLPVLDLHSAEAGNT